MPVIVLSKGRYDSEAIEAEALGLLRAWNLPKAQEGALAWSHGHMFLQNLQM